MQDYIFFLLLCVCVELRENSKRSTTKMLLSMLGPRCVCVGVCVCVHTHAQSCRHLTLCGPMDCSPLGSSVSEISLTRILGWVAISYSMDLPEPGVKPASLASSALADGFFTINTTWKPISNTDFLKLYGIIGTIRVVWRTISSW